MKRNNDLARAAATPLAQVVMVLALAALLLAGCNPAPSATGGRPAAGPSGAPGGPSRGMPVIVITEQVMPTDFVDRFTALGTARANESIEVTSRTSSIVTRINFREGQRVRPGDVLVELDTRQEQANLSLAEAQLAQAESQFRRSQALAETRVVSEADLEQLEAQVLIGRAQVRGARARLDTLTVKAPFAGTVGLRKVSLGDLVGPETLITTLDDTATIRLEFTVPEAFVATLRPGLTIEAQGAVFPGRRFTGQVTSIDTRVDPVSRSVLVVAKVPNDDDALKPGMFLTVALEKSRTDVLLVPEEALVPREGRQFVFVVQDGKALEREVTLGGRAPGFAEVRAGLEPGAVVITEGTQRVRNGTPVQVAPSS